MSGEWIAAKDNVCPRCLGWVPRAEAKGEYPGALSRYDNAHEVCSACGVDEAMGTGIVPLDLWPMIRPWTEPDNVRTWVRVNA